MEWKFVIIAPKDYGMDQHINHSNDLLIRGDHPSSSRNRNDNLIHSICYPIFSNLFRTSFYSNEMMVKTNSFRVNFYIFKTRNTRNMFFFFPVFITYETPTNCYQGFYELTSTHASALRIMRSYREIKLESGIKIGNSRVRVLIQKLDHTCNTSRDI
jgi:hypothetical protein